jgi:hypothetical protein
VPESTAFRQLEQLVRHLGDELTFFRKRAHAAEARVRSLEAAVAAGGNEQSLERLAALEAENGELRSRLDHAAQQARQLAARVKFMRQQQNGRVTTPATTPGVRG